MESTVAPQTSPALQRPTLPAPVWRILLFGAVALAAGTGLASLATRSTSRSFSGTLTARIVPIAAPTDGVLSQLLVSEGEEIEIGQPLASLTTPSLERRTAELDAEITRLHAELDRARAVAELELDWRMKDVQETIFAARLQSAEYLEEQHRHEMEKVALTELLTLDSTAFSTPPDTVIDSLILKNSASATSRLDTVLRLEAATNASEVCAAQVELCDDQVAWLEELKDSLPERVRTSAGVDVAEQRLEAARQERAALSEERAVSVVSSTAIGRTGVFLKRVGEFVSTGNPIVEVLDEAQRLVVVDVPSEDVGLFSAGRVVTVIFPGTVRAQGRVVHVAPQAVTAAGDPGSDSIVRVHLEQAGTVWPPLPVGARVEVRL